VLELRWRLDEEHMVKTVCPNTWKTVLRGFTRASRLQAGLSFVRSPWFDFFVQCTILANAIYVVQAASQHGADYNEEKHGTFANYAFFVLYVIEGILKLAHYGIRAYFQDAWNTFDFLVVLSSVAGFFLGSSGVSVGTVLRSARLLRLFRIRRKIRHVLLTMAFLLRRLGMYIVALLLLMYSFAMVGMAAFADTVSRRCDPYYAHPDFCNAAFGAPTFYQLMNFDNILYAFNTLFALMIVNNWHLIMVRWAEGRWLGPGAVPGQPLGSGFRGAAVLLL
jgi:hypothetical protein